MNTVKKEIPLFTACDDNYIPFLAVTLQSITDNASREYDYVFRVLHTGVNEENIKKIMKYNTENFRVEFVDIRNTLNDVMQRLHTEIYYTQTTYYRLFIANLYPQYDKILYIDCDVVVRGDISQLYNIDIADNLVGAVTDEFVINEPYVHQYVNEVLGFKNLKDYFNAGVLLINLDQFRKQKFEEQFSDLLNKYKFIVQDQDYLNIICRNKVKYIDSSWDKMPCNQDARLEDINLIHFNLIWKPWHTEVPYGEEFWKYADKTEFKDEIRNIRANYTKEQYQKDVDHYNFFMGKIHDEYYNPNNYFHLFLEKKRLKRNRYGITSITS